MQDLPKYHETFIPILETLSKNGTLQISDLRNEVRAKYYSKLTDEQLSKKTKAGDPLILNRIGWGKAYLKQAKLVEQPQRGLVKITEKGLRTLKKGSLTLQEVLKDADFLSYHHMTGEEVVDTKLESFDTPEDMIARGIDAIDNQVKTDLLTKLKKTDPFFFETIILKLFQKMGYGDFIVTKRSGDGGIDGIINQDQFGIDVIYTQAKRYTDSKVREPEIRNFIGAIEGGTDKGIFVTTSSFDDSAKAKAQRSHKKIILIDGNHLVELMYKHGIGVQVKNHIEIKSIDEDFFEDQ